MLVQFDYAMVMLDYVMVHVVLLQATCCLQLIESRSLLQQVILIVERVNDIFKIPHLDSDFL